MEKFFKKFNERFWYWAISLLVAALLSLIGYYSDVDAKELPDETEPVIEQPKPKTKKPVSKPKRFTNPVNKKSEDKKEWELVGDYKELAA